MTVSVGYLDKGRCDAEERRDLDRIPIPQTLLAALADYFPIQQKDSLQEDRIQSSFLVFVFRLLRRA